MPYIIENGEKRFVTQEEYVDWARGQGLPTSGLRDPRNQPRPPAGGTDLSVSQPQPQSELTGSERRALVNRQQRQVDDELSNIDSRLAQNSTGQNRLSFDEVQYLENRKSQLGDAANQLENGQPVTSGLIEGGRTTEQFILPNTNVNIPQNSLPQQYENSARLGATNSIGYIPAEDDFIGRVAVGQNPGVSSYTPRSTELENVNVIVPQTIDLIDPDANRGQGFVPYRQVTQESPYSFPGVVPGPVNYSVTDDRGSSSYYNTPSNASNPFAFQVQTQAEPVDDAGQFNTNTNQSIIGAITRQPEVPVNDPASGQAAAAIAASTQAASDALRNGRTPAPVNIAGVIGANQFNQATNAGILGTITNNPVSPVPVNTQVASNVAVALQQNSIRSQRSGFNEKDWRVRLALAPQAQYLYNVASMGDLLWPLAGKGVIFPYTPTIQTAYKANYQPYDLTHSNMRGYFYQGSSPSEIQITGVFTAQDTTEANYLLAVIHFFKSATKMFYGQDAYVGAPPPPLYLSGYGTYQFREHPVLLTSFNFSLPNDVDYIRARSVSINGTDLVVRRPTVPSPPNTSPIFSAISRLKTIFTPKGAEPKAKAAQPFDTSGQSVELGGENPTYVPTQMEISLTLLPIQSRSQMSKQFSLTQFAQGSLLKGGFW